MHVQNHVTVVGDHTFPVHRVAAQLHQLASHVAACHRNHFHGQRETAQYRNELAGIGDTDEGARHSGDDLLAGQGRAAALDQVQVGIALVGAVHIELQLAHTVELVHRNPMVLQTLGGRFRTGHGAVERAFVTRQRIDEEVGGRAGAHADDALVIQLGQNEIDGSLGDGLLELILGHAGSEKGREKRNDGCGA